MELILKVSFFYSRKIPNENEKRAFASIEMGGVFPLNDENQFNKLNSQEIISNLKQVSVESGTQEESIIYNLCGFV